MKMLTNLLVSVVCITLGLFAFGCSGGGGGSGGVPVITNPVDPPEEPPIECIDKNLHIFGQPYTGPWERGEISGSPEVGDNFLAIGVYSDPDLTFLVGGKFTTDPNGGDGGFIGPDGEEYHLWVGQGTNCWQDENGTINELWIVVYVGTYEEGDINEWGADINHSLKNGDPVHPLSLIYISLEGPDDIEIWIHGFDDSFVWDWDILGPIGGV